MRSVVAAALLVGSVSWLVSAVADEPDCNLNGVPDSQDIVNGVSEDCNENGVPDECDTRTRFASSIIGPGDQLTDLAVADVDGDLDADVAFTEYGGTVGWYENPGDAAVPWTEHEIVLLEDYTRIHLADLDDDGDPDLILSFEGVWYENISGDSFLPTHFVPAQTLPSGTMAVTDVDGDSDPDLVIGSADAFVWVENLDGAGTFGPAQAFGSPGAYVTDVDAADMDADGDNDIVGALWAEDPALIWFENLDGLGAFGPLTPIEVEGVWGRRVAIADADADGDLDVWTVQLVLPTIIELHELAWYENRLAHNEAWIRHPIDSHVDSFFEISDLIAADLDGDSDLDLARGWYSSGGLITGDPHWMQLPERRQRGTAGTDTEQGEFDSGDIEPDGDVDIVVVTESIEWPYSEYIQWLENQGNDCNGDQVPDACEPDCNLNGIADACDLRDGPGVDCDSNGVPDECQTHCTTGCDHDGDICIDDLDCAPADPTLWSDPGGVGPLTLVHDRGVTTIGWNAPIDPGASAVRYDLLRSALPQDFHGGSCIESDDADTSAEDSDPVDGGGIYFYLVRVENDCPGSAGAMGTDSDGVPRSGLACR